MTAMMAVQGQKTISGSLVSSADNKAVPFANIALLRQADSSFLRGTTSGMEGRFTLDGDTVATLLRISAIGFETLWVPVADSSATATLDLGTLQLTEGATTLDAVNIVAKKPMYASDGEKRIYNVSEDPTIQNGTAQDALQNAPGVQVDGDGNITLNGKAVTVYINDRESHYEGEMLKQYIKTLTADQISSIEAIEYPSAKYGGGGPVINIRTEQNLLRNSYLSFGGYGSTEPAFSPFISYAYANKKLRFDAYVRFSSDRDESHSDGDGRMYDANNNLMQSSSYKYDSKNTSRNIGLNLSFGYDFDTMNTLSAYFHTWPYWSSSKGEGRYIRFDSVNGVMQDYSHSTYSDNNRASAFGYGSMDFTHKFDNEGHQISFSLGGNYSFWGNKGTDWEHYDMQPQMSYDERTETSSPSGSLDLGVNYSYPYSDKGEISAGIDYSHRNFHSYELRDTLAADGLYHCDILRSDSTTGPTNSVRLYLSWRRKWGNFTVRIGSSLSYTHDNYRHLGLPQYDTTSSYFAFSPSILLMYNTESGHSFTLNYSTDLSHPSSSSLCRYEEYGIESYSTGNPDLEPSRSHNLGFSYDKYFDAGHSIGINGSLQASTNEVTHLNWPEYVPFFGRYVSYGKPFNGNDNRKASVYVYARYRFSGNLSVTLSGGAEDDWYSTLVRPDEKFEDELAAWNMRLSTRARLFKVLWVSVSGYYSSRSHGWSALSINEPSFGASISASADLFDRKLSIYLIANDIFNTQAWNSSEINPYMPSTSNYKYTSQYISFGITLRFGKMELGNSGQEGIQSSGSRGGGK